MRLFANYKQLFQFNTNEENIMYECPNCAANLKYHIGKQMLFCENCDTTVDPYSFHKEQDAEEHTEYEVTIFTCPQCGGEIISEDTTAATFCSFCGSSTILDSRISKEKRPTYIIPFSKTEANCRTAYKKMLKQAIFAPDDLKDENQIKKFRGIYMPYWVYSFEKKGPVSFKGHTSRRRGDYIYTKHYDLNCDIDADYKGVSFDASSTFCDNLSNAIAPFDIKKGKPFAPAFLSGFYADTSDVDNSLYKSDAEEMILDVQCQQIQNKSPFSRYHVGEHPSSLKNVLRPDKTNAELALFPVWFLSYRKGDRVAYAVVNGQTGKAAADLPVDNKKFLIGSLILAVPIFILLNLFFTLKPNWLLLLVAILALICTIISNVQINRVKQRESGEDDRGLQYRKWSDPKAASIPLSEMRDDAGGNDSLLSRFQDQLNDVSLKKKKESTSQTGKVLLYAVIIMVIMAFAPNIMMLLVKMMANFVNFETMVDFYIFFFIATTIILFLVPLSIRIKKNNARSGKKGNWLKNLPLLVKPLVGIVATVLILIINPVEDMIYYLGAIFCMGMVAWGFVDIINRHNILSTRKLPQLNKRGGDEVE